MMSGAENYGFSFAIVYVLVINVVGFALMCADKGRARRHAWRIPEKSFFIVSIAGGSIGTWLGMYIFRHKTRHWYFVVGIPLILVLQLLWLFGR